MRRLRWLLYLFLADIVVSMAVFYARPDLLAKANSCAALVVR